MVKNFKLKVQFIVLGLFLIVVPNGSATDWWDSVNLIGNYGVYDTSGAQSGKPTPSLEPSKEIKWNQPIPKKKYTIGVSFPHLKDPFWLAVNSGIINEAKDLNVGIELVAAQGYDSLQEQVHQMESLAASGLDGIIIGSISYVSCDPVIEKVTNMKIPVISLVNDTHSGALQGKVMVPYYETGKKAAEFLYNDAKAKNKKNVKIAHFPGPAGSGWAKDAVLGFQDKIKELAPQGFIEVVDTKWGDMGRDVQYPMVQNVITANPDLDYIIANTLAAAVAPQLLEAAGMKDKTMIISAYMNGPLFNQIKEGAVACGVSDWPSTQGRIAVDMMVRLLNGEKPGKDYPFQITPVPAVMTPENYNEFQYDLIFGEKGWKAKFTVEPK